LSIVVDSAKLPYAKVSITVSSWATGVASGVADALGSGAFDAAGAAVAAGGVADAGTLTDGGALAPQPESDKRQIDTAADEIIRRAGMTLLTFVRP
jgi:hypothetical protein